MTAAWAATTLTAEKGAVADRRASPYWADAIRASDVRCGGPLPCGAPPRARAAPPPLRPHVVCCLLSTLQVHTLKIIQA
eukprot:6209390-Pleurochrysis_carterae.AAC.1